MLFILWTCALICATFGDEVLPADIRRAMENPDLFGGDMLVSMDDDRNVIPEQYKRWTQATVPYVIDSSLQQYTDDIRKAMANYEATTCVRFVPRTNQRNYIRIFSGNGCYARVGMDGGQQPVSLAAPGCLHLGTIVHELGHSLGLWHEQNRSDRDDYLNVYIHNVVPGMEFNFKKFAPHENLLLTPFDYDSIMIYDSTAFSKDGESITMEAKNGHKLVPTYFKPDGMSPTDIIRIRKMYRCQ